MKKALQKAEQEETSDRGKKVLEQLKENLEIAETEMIPICQDTGMAVFF
jgi:fumarate hydratase subunit alpha